MKIIFFATKCHATIEPRILLWKPNNGNYYYKTSTHLNWNQQITSTPNNLNFYEYFITNAWCTKKSKQKLVDEYMTNTDLCPITANSNTYSYSSVHLWLFYLLSGTSNANDHTHTATKFFPPLKKLVLQRDGVKIFYLRSVHTLW